MNQAGTKSDTPKAKTALVVVPGHTRLFRRGAIYYFRAKVPEELRHQLKKKEIRYSLKTADFKKAKQACNIASVKADAEFAGARKTLPALTPSAPAKLTDEQLFYIVASWFQNKERESEQWAAQECARMDEDERAEVMDNLKGDAAAYSSSSDERESWTDSLIQEVMQSSPGLSVERGSADFNRLIHYAKRAMQEHLNRKIERTAGLLVNSATDPLFARVFAHSPLKAPRETATLKQVTERFMERQRKRNANTTPVTYSIPVRILIEVLGPQKLISEVTEEDVWKVGEALEKIPAHVSQRYKGKPLLSAIASADREGNQKRLSRQTVSKYFTNVCAIFKFALGRGWLETSPSKGAGLKEQFCSKSRRKPTPQFTSAELNSLFRAPLYAGCIDDETNFSKPGPNHPKRGRFWVPLLSLFHGLRCNEACQLYAEDVKEAEGIHYLDIRTTLDDDEEADDKHTKNENSIRQVPLHPQIIKLGFLQFVELRRRDGAKARLFPDLESGKSTGRYSTRFSKWFSRFKEKACGHLPKARFHSFRHHFRTELARAGVQLEYTNALCGWDSEERGMEKLYFQAKLKELKAAVAKVSYEGLDLSHLETAPSPHIEKKQRVRYRPQPL